MTPVAIQMVNADCRSWPMLVEAANAKLRKLMLSDGPLHDDLLVAMVTTNINAHTNANPKNILDVDDDANFINQSPDLFVRCRRLEG